MRRRRRSEPTPIRALLSRWLSRKGMEAELVQYEILLRWPELVGDRVAERTEPELLKNGRLTIRVASAAWLNELSFLRDDLVRQINAGLGDARVKEVRLLAGPVRARSRSAVAPRPPVEPEEGLSKPQLAEVELAAAEVDDEALRQAVRRAGAARLRSKMSKMG